MSNFILAAIQMIFMYFLRYHYIVFLLCLEIVVLKYTSKYPLIVDNNNTQKSYSCLSMLIIIVRFTK